MKKRIALLLVIVLTACTMHLQTDDVDAATGKVKSIKVTNVSTKTLTLKKGKTKVLKVKVSTVGKKVSKAVIFKSSNSKVAKVSKKGKITAKKNGKAVISIYSKANKKKKVKINVVVGKPVAGIKLDKANQTILVNQTMSLKATVTNADASNKKIVWSSTNAGVAAVSSTGVVTGKKAGNTQIIATAQDGSGKKAVCNVTVNEPVNEPVKIEKINIANEYTIQIALSKAVTLNQSNFKVKYKEYGEEGTFNNECAIEFISTTDNKNYTITIKPIDFIYMGDIVQVVINGITNQKSISIQSEYITKPFNYSDEYIYKLAYKTYKEIDFECEGYGYRNVKVTNLPSGMNYSIIDEGTVHIYGTPRVKGKIESKIECVDKLGNTYTYLMCWIIGASDTIAAAASKTYGVIAADDQIGVQVRKISVTGGSGTYTYSLVGDEQDFKVNSDGWIEGTIRNFGKHSVEVLIKDYYNPELTTTVEAIIDIALGAKIEGIVTDALGNPIPNADIRFKDCNLASLYPTECYVTSDAKGAYSAVIVPGNHDISIGAYGTGKNLFNQKFSKGYYTFNITVPLYKVNVSSDNNKIAATELGTWYDSLHRPCGEGNTVWLKPGYNELTTNKKISIFNVEGSIKINANINTKNIIAKVKYTQNQPSGTLILNEAKNVTIKYIDDYEYYCFVPQKTGYYRFYTQNDSEMDTYGALYNKDGKFIVDNDDGDDMWNFSLVNYCTAGQSYYIGIRGCNYSDLGQYVALYVKEY